MTKQRAIPASTIITSMLAYVDARASGWDQATDTRHGDYQYAARHEARAIAAQLHDIAANFKPPPP